MNVHCKYSDRETLSFHYSHLQIEWQIIWSVHRRAFSVMPGMHRELRHRAHPRSLAHSHHNAASRLKIHQLIESHTHQQSPCSRAHSSHCDARCSPAQQPASPPSARAPATSTHPPAAVYDPASRRSSNRDFSNNQVSATWSRDSMD